MALFSAARSTKPPIPEVDRQMGRAGVAQLAVSRRSRCSAGHKNEDSVGILGFWHFFVSWNPRNLRSESSSPLVSTALTHSGDDEDSEDSGIIAIFFFAAISGIFPQNPAPKRLRPALGRCFVVCASRSLRGAKKHRTAVIWGTSVSIRAPARIPLVSRARALRPARRRA